jgi:hypothetical protein
MVRIKEQTDILRGKERMATNGGRPAEMQNDNDAQRGIEAGRRIAG